MANKEFGNKLRELRNKKGLTQQQVADHLGLKYKGTVGNWEIGNSEPDALTFLKLCDLYDVGSVRDEFLNVSIYESPRKRSILIVAEEPDKTIIKKFQQLSERNKYRVEGTIDAYIKEQNDEKRDSDTEFANELA